MIKSSLILLRELLRNLLDDMFRAKKNPLLKRALNLVIVIERRLYKVKRGQCQSALSNKTPLSVSMLSAIFSTASPGNFTMDSPVSVSLTSTTKR